MWNHLGVDGLCGALYLLVARYLDLLLVVSYSGLGEPPLVSELPDHVLADSEKGRHGFRLK